MLEIKTRWADYGWCQRHRPGTFEVLGCERRQGRHGDVVEPALKQAAEELKGDVATVLCNVTKEEDCARLADTAIEIGQINLVAPFAGIFSDGLLIKTDRETGRVTGSCHWPSFQKVIDINLTGVFLTVRECIERMVNHGCRGLVLSRLLHRFPWGLPARDQIILLPKAAMSVMPKVLTASFFRRGLADQIRCVAVAPGMSALPWSRPWMKRLA